MLTLCTEIKPKRLPLRLERCIRKGTACYLAAVSTRCPEPGAPSNATSRCPSTPGITCYLDTVSGGTTYNSWRIPTTAATSQTSSGHSLTTTDPITFSTLFSQPC